MKKYSFCQLFRAEYNDIKAVLGKDASDADVLEYLNAQAGKSFNEFEILD